MILDDAAAPVKQSLLRGSRQSHKATFTLCAAVFPPKLQYEPSSSGTLPARQGFAAPSSQVAETPSYPAAILQHKAPW
ncbi:hypothetical protein [Thermincola potens]|uniref:hypothetical protein n=1 Tax=Thermincola potens TaxID=863643 RepID=UPI0012FDE1EA|nr:hypothetical protein [Thermincola potens]